MFTELVNDSWIEYYIDYQGLKNCIKQIIEYPSQKSEDSFVVMIRENYKRCNSFFYSQIDNIKNELRQDDSDTKYLMQRASDLYNYSIVNRLSFYKILKKHDGISKLKMLPYYSVKLHYNNFCPLNDVYYLFSVISMKKLADREAMFKKLNPKQRFAYLETEPLTEQYKDLLNNSYKDTQEESFIRRSEKFWIVPTELPNVMNFVSKFIPMYFFNENEAALSTTSIYLDNDDFDCYVDRRSKKENAYIIRFRWYGDFDSTENIFVEMKEHHEDWSYEKSSKNRFSLKKNRVDSFLNDLSFEYDSSMGDEKLITDVKKYIHQKKLKPVLATKYIRFAYQDTTNDFIRVSIDTNLRMIKKTGSFADWADCENYIDTDNIHMFPFGVMEIKLRDPFIDNRPTWLSELASLKGVIPTPDFSKYAHGAALLHNLDYPEWIIINRDIFEETEPLEGINDIKKIIDINTPIKKIVKIDPKFTIQNERLLFNWIGVAISLLKIVKRSDKKLHIFTKFLSICIIISGLINYFLKIRKLRSGNIDNFDNPIGSIGLAVAVIIIMIADSINL